MSDGGEPTPKRKFNWPLVIVVVCVILGLVLVYVGIKGWLNTFIGQLLAVAFLSVGIYGLHKKWWESGRFLILATFSFCIFFASQAWMQGFIQHEALSFLLNISEEAGKKLKEFQNTTYEIQGQVKTQQDELARHQTAITDAQGKLLSQESTIASQQTTIATQQVDIAQQQAKMDEQQKRLSDVEGLVKHFFELTRTERIRGSETNRAFIFTIDNKACQVFFQLNNVPIETSIQGTVGNFPLKPGTINIFRNIAYGWFEGDTNQAMNQEYYFSYVVDVLHSNQLSTASIHSNNLDIAGNDGITTLLVFPENEKTEKEAVPKK